MAKTPPGRSNRYIELYEKIIGEKFLPQHWNDKEIFESIVAALEKLK